MAHHGPVQPVLGHDAPPTPGFLRLSPLGPAVLEPHLAGRERKGRRLQRAERCAERWVGLVLTDEPGGA